MIETKCAAFWKHSNLRQGNQVYPCCRFKTPIATYNGDLDNLLHIQPYDDLRKKSSNNEFISECSKCYHEEAIGKQSLRQQFNNDYDTDSIELKYLEIGFDNICNLKCDACGPEFSHTWSKELYPNIDKGTHIISPNVEIKPSQSLEKVFFLGGEPLMTNRHEKFLEQIDNPKQVSVYYVTNATFLFTKEQITLLNSFKDVVIYVSIDGYGALNDEVRKNSKWSDVLDFLDQIRKQSWKTIINTTIHNNNWFGISDLKDFVNNYNYEWQTNFVTYPPQLDIANSLEKNKIFEYFQTVDFPNKEATLEHIKRGYNAT